MREDTITAARKYSFSSNWESAVSADNRQATRTFVRSYKLLAGELGEIANEEGKGAHNPVTGVAGS